MSDNESGQFISAYNGSVLAIGHELDPRIASTRFIKGTFEIQFENIDNFGNRHVSSAPVNIGGLGWSCTVWETVVGDGEHFHDLKVYLSVEITASGRQELKHFECQANCEVVLKNQAAGPDIKWEFSETFKGTNKCSIKKDDFIEWANLNEHFVIKDSICIQVSISPENVAARQVDDSAPVQTNPVPANSAAKENVGDGAYYPLLISEVTRAILFREDQLLSYLLGECPPAVNHLDMTTRLVEAIEQSNVKCCETILKSEAMSGEHGAAAVRAAVRLLQRAFHIWKRVLLKHGTGIDQTDGEHITHGRKDENEVLHYACKIGGSKELIKFLLGQGILVTADRNGKMPHQSAMEYDINVDALKVLLQRDIQLNVRYPDAHYHELVLNLAKHGNLELLRFVFGGVIVHYACIKGSSDLIQLLLAHGCPVTKNVLPIGELSDNESKSKISNITETRNILPHHVAAYYRNISALRTLLEHDLQTDVTHADEDYAFLAKLITLLGDAELLQSFFERHISKILRHDAGDELLTALIEQDNMEGFRSALKVGYGSYECSVKKPKMKSLFAAIQHEDPTYFSLLVDKLTWGVVSECTANYELKIKTQGSVMDPQDQDYPIIVAIQSKRVDRLRALLSVGFSPKIPAYTSRKTGGYMLQASNLNRYSIRPDFLLPHTLLSYAMFQLSFADGSVVEETVQTLLDYGAQVYGDPLASAAEVAESLYGPCYKMPPIVAVMWHVGKIFDPESPIMRVLRMLLDKGANFNYRAPNSIFTSPDFALIPAFFGNVTLLAHALGNSSFVKQGAESEKQDRRNVLSSGDILQSAVPIEDPPSSSAVRKRSLNLLNDMFKFVYGPFHFGEDYYYNGEDPHFPRDLSEAVATSVNTALKFADGWDQPELADVCEKLDEKFRFRPEPCGGCTGDAEPQEVAHASDDSAWERVRRTLKTLGTLQHMCRVAVNRRLVRCDPRFTRNFENVVRELPVPDMLKDFLY